jgi:hypothetical protein
VGESRKRENKWPVSPPLYVSVVFVCRLCAGRAAGVHGSLAGGGLELLVEGTPGGDLLPGGTTLTTVTKPPDVSRVVGW